MESYRVGFGRTCITPDFKTSLAGYGNYKNRTNQNTIDDLYASCIAITDTQETTVLIFALDSMNVPTEFIEPVREKLSTQFRIPLSNILINASHSHSTPLLYNSAIAFGCTEFRALVTNQICEAAKLALSDRTVAEMYSHRGIIQNLNFVKHYFLDNGTCAGDNHGSFQNAKILSHTTEPDPEIRFLKFVRKDQPTIVLANWQGHPLITGGIQKTDLSADYIGGARKYVESAFPNTYFAFLQGCAGDMNTRSYIKAENPPQNYDAFAALLGPQITALLTEKMTPVIPLPIQTKAFTYMGQVNHSQDHLVDQAISIQKFFYETGDRVTGNQMCREVGFASVYHAGAVVLRSKFEETLPLELFAVSLGDVALVSSPTECFHKLGEYVREKSPFSMTMTLGYTNGYRSYMPTREAYEYGCYEADVARFVPGTGEIMADIQVKMLQALKEG